ncbi:antirestriction protein ArdA [Nocardioides sp. SYSU DS0651]|uniref:antirestriction protein ArdA n=1 Tax=Nocardioides sp. SYSU DS0651 TaxID=3415955 RepID=UPI003F4BF6E7
MTTITVDARVWIGCLHCYNGGALVGEWYDAGEADAVCIDALHIDAGAVARVSCEEMWVMDHEGLPISGECSPAEAAEWGRLLGDVADWQRDALLAWVRSGDYIAEGTGDLPSLPDFEERYAGEWPSFREYAECLMDETGMTADLPEWARPYFDMDAYARDLTFDHTTEPAPGGGVYVFRSL